MSPFIVTLRSPDVIFNSSGLSNRRRWPWVNNYRLIFLVNVNDYVHKSKMSLLITCSYTKLKLELRDHRVKSTNEFIMGSSTHNNYTYREHATEK